MPAAESAESAVPGDDLVALVGLLREQNAALLAQNEALADYNARLAERVQQQDGEIVRLRARVAELERRLGRNSGNSNLPPSTDVFGRPGKDEQDEAKRKPTRPRGKQKGAPGSALRQVEAPDRIVEHRPAACTECGQDLAGIGPEQVTRRQVFDIPLVTVAVTEHRLCTLRCDCGRLTAAAAPDQVPASAVAYGPHLRALAVYLVVRQHVPVERTAELIREVTGAQVSAGWVASLLPRTAELVAPSLELIRALLVLSHVLHADETTTRIGAERHWLHVACTARLTLLGLAARSQAGADSLGVLPRFRGTLVHDSLGFYHRYTACTHQLCGAHLIRELTAAEEDHPKEQWHQQIRWALAGLNRQARRVASGEIEELPPDSLLFYLTAYHRGVTAGLARHPRTPGRGQSPAHNLLTRLRDHADQVLRFADHPRSVPMTNNTGERALRPVKTQLKISGCHQCEAGAANWLAIRSYLDSARKHGLSAFEAIRRAFTGTLWMPPIAQHA